MTLILALSFAGVGFWGLGNGNGNLITRHGENNFISGHGVEIGNTEQIGRDKLHLGIHIPESKKDNGRPYTGSVRRLSCVGI